MSKKQGIVRFAGDTYPNTIVIKINGVPIDITGWHIFMTFKEVGGTTRKVVDGIVSNPREGRVKFYPFCRNENEPPLAFKDFVTDQMQIAAAGAMTSNQCWNIPNKNYTFSVKRKRIYDAPKWNEYNNGQYSDIDFEEVMTHLVSNIYILDSV